MTGTRRRRHNQWFAYEEAMVPAVRESAQRSADRTGQPQRIHHHYMGNGCSKKCETVKAKK